MLAPRYATTNKHNWKKPVTTYQDMEGTATLTSTPYATLTESGSRAFYGNYNFLMTFKKNFSGHDLKLILGAERNTYDYKYLSAYRQVFNYPTTIRSTWARSRTWTTAATATNGPSNPTSAV